MSWGGSEFKGETAYDTSAYFANPNVTFVAASGDDGGASGAEWPAVSPVRRQRRRHDPVALELGDDRQRDRLERLGLALGPATAAAQAGVSVYESAPTYQVGCAGQQPTPAARRPTFPPTPTPTPACRSTTRSPARPDRLVPGRRHQRRGAGLGRPGRRCRPGPRRRTASARSARPRRWTCSTACTA